MAKLKVLPASPSVVALGGLTALVLMAAAPAPRHAAVPMQASGAVNTPAVPPIAPAPTREAAARVVYTGPVVMSSEAAAQLLQAPPADVSVVPTSPTSGQMPIDAGPHGAHQKRTSKRGCGAVEGTSSKR